MCGNPAANPRILRATSGVDVAWMAQQLAAPNPDVLGAFAATELADAGDGFDRSQRLAARLAAKQACLQLFPHDVALGIVAAADFTIERDGYGAPHVVESPRVRALLDRSRVRAIAVSLTHDATAAAAVAIAEPMETTVPAAGKLIYYLLPLRRRVMRENLRRVFGERISEAEVVRLAQAHYAHYVRLVFEFFQFRWLTAGRRASLVRIENPDALRRAADQGKGVLVVTAHFGNWEVATVAAASSFPEYRERFHTVRRYIWPRWFYRMLNNRQRRAGIGVLEKKGSLDALLQRLGAGDVVVFVLDQHAAGRDGVRVELFGHPASVFRSPAIIARATGAPVVPAACWRDADGRHVMRFEEAIPAVACDDSEASVRVNTRAYLAEIERFMLRHPEQWGMWMHRLWKGGAVNRRG